MIGCEFSSHYRQDGKCLLGLNIPKAMSCREFSPGIEKFCSNPNDFVNPSQITQMATFFGFKKAELKKIKLMAEAAETSRQAEQENTASLNAVSPL